MSDTKPVSSSSGIRFEDAIINALSAEAFWVVNKKIQRAIGAESACFLSELISKYRYWRDRGQLQADGSFFMTAEDIMLVMGCKERAAKRITKEIQVAGVVKVVKRGVPAKNHWYIQWVVIQEIMTGAPSSQAETVPTGEAESVTTSQGDTGPTRGAETVPSYTKNTESETKPKKKDANTPALYKRAGDLVGDAHYALKKEPLIWKTFEKAYGRALADCLLMASAAYTALGKQETYEDYENGVFKVFRAKVVGYYTAALRDNFLAKQGVTPLSLKQNWNKVDGLKSAPSAFAADEQTPFPDVLQLTDEETRAAFTDWQKKFTISQVRKHLPKPIWEKWQTEKNGFADALPFVIMAYKSENGIGVVKVAGLDKNHTGAAGLFENLRT